MLFRYIRYFIEEFKNEYNIPELTFKEIKDYLITAINRRIKAKEEAYLANNQEPRALSSRQQRIRGPPTQEGGNKKTRRKKPKKQ